MALSIHRPSVATPDGSSGLSVVEFFTEQLTKLGLETVPSHANFILVKVGDGDAIFEQLQKEGIITRPMMGYGLPEWIRVSIGTPDENMRCLETLQNLCSTSSLNS